MPVGSTPSVTAGPASITSRAWTRAWARPCSVTRNLSIAHPLAASSSLHICDSASQCEFSRLTVVAQATKRTVAGKGFGVVAKPKEAWASEAACPCQSGKTYQECCKACHTGTARAADPEALLRSRYSAYVIKDPEYIVDTTHPESPEISGSLKQYLSKVKTTQKRLNPVGLIIQGPMETGTTPDEAYITFTVKIAKEGADKTDTSTDDRTERSRFLQAGGRWLFVDSKFLD